jgi:phosphoribosylamine--glycine ligase/phosphoribosylformylglycinamidine cyclo-ligase
MLIAAHTGNGGTASGFKNVSNVNIGVGAFKELVEFAVKNEIDLVLPGPEAPLVDGIEGHFRKGIALFISIYRPRERKKQLLI